MLCRQQDGTPADVALSEVPDEALDDRFSTCWNCGTNADVVELCSAANSVEAFTIADAIEAAGIKASVVGDVLQATAAGAIPLGEASAPRIWVTRQHEQKARELLAQLQADAAEVGPSPGTGSEAGDEAWAEAGEPAEEPVAEPRPRHDVSLLSVLLALAGLGSIGVGIHYGVTNGWLLARYSRSAKATCVDAHADLQPHSGRIQIPNSPDRRTFDWTVVWKRPLPVHGGRRFARLPGRDR